MKDMNRLRKGGHVRRYHTVETIGQQTVADHSWGVAMMVLQLQPDASANLLKAALFHDLAEYDTGDTPAHAKWRSKPLKTALDDLERTVEDDLGIGVDLTSDELITLKVADMLELLWFCVEQARMGNRNVDEIWERGNAFLKENSARFHLDRSAAFNYAYLELTSVAKDIFP